MKSRTMTVPPSPMNHEALLGLLKGVSDDNRCVCHGRWVTGFLSQESEPPLRRGWCSFPRGGGELAADGLREALRELIGERTLRFVGLNASRACSWPAICWLWKWATGLRQDGSREVRGGSFGGGSAGDGAGGGVVDPGQCGLGGGRRAAGGYAGGSGGPSWRQGGDEGRAGGCGRRLVGGAAALHVGRFVLVRRTSWPITRRCGWRRCREGIQPACFLHGIAGWARRISCRDLPAFCADASGKKWLYMTGEAFTNGISRGDSARTRRRSSGGRLRGVELAGAR